MALPRIEVEVTADTADAEAGLQRVGNRATQLGGDLRRAQRSTASFQRGIQNAAFQVGDFAVQVGSGTRASVALAQQLPQLLGGFGALGAVLGAAVAIGAPLVRVMSDLNTEGRDMTEVFGTLQPVARGIADAMRTAGQMMISFAEAVVNNIDRILVIGGTAAAFFAGKWVAGFVAARIATFSLASALVTLRGALIRTGIGAVIVAAGELIFQFTRLVQAAGGFGGAMVALKGVAVEAWQRIEDAVHVAELRITAAAIRVGVAWREALAGITGADPGTDFAREAMGNLTDQADILSNNLTRPLESIQNIRDLIAGMKDEGFTLDDLFGGGEGEDGDEPGKRLQDRLDDQAQRIQEHFERIKALTTGGLSDQLGGWNDYFSNLATLTQSSNDRLLKIAKAFGAAQALVDAWSAYNQVLADPTLPFFAKFAAGAQVLAAGIGAVNSIRSVSASGGGSGSGGGAAGAPRGISTGRGEFCTARRPAR